MNENVEKLERHRSQILKILAVSGWALAILSLFLSTYFLNKLHLEIVEMQQENKELRIGLERARLLTSANPRP